MVLSHHCVDLGSQLICIGYYRSHAAHNHRSEALFSIVIHRNVRRWTDVRLWGLGASCESEGNSLLAILYDIVNTSPEHDDQLVFVT